MEEFSISTLKVLVSETGVPVSRLAGDGQGELISSGLKGFIAQNSHRVVARMKLCSANEPASVEACFRKPKTVVLAE